MNSIAVVQLLRLESQRLPGKVLRKIRDRSLLEIAMEKLSYLSELDNNIHPIYICPERDKPIIDILDKKGVEYYLMNDEQASVKMAPYLLHPFLFYLADYDKIWDINLICHPFMSLLSLREITKKCHETPYAFMITTEHRGIIWDSYSHCIYGRHYLPCTKTNPSYQVPAHIACVWNQEHLTLPEDRLALSTAPIPMKFRPEELIDIDTKEDLELANRIGI